MIDYTKALGPISAIGHYNLGNVAEMAKAQLRLSTRLASGTGITWGLRLRLTGSGISDANAPRTGFYDVLGQANVAAATAITPTSTAQIHEIDCGGCDVILSILTNSGSGVLEVFGAPLTQGA